MNELINPKRRKENAEMERLGIKTKKEYRKIEKKMRRVSKLTPPYIEDYLKRMDVTP